MLVWIEAGSLPCGPNTILPSPFRMARNRQCTIVLEDANTHTTASLFDLASEMTQKTLPDGSLTEARTYDNNGNLSTITHFNGVTTTYGYDNLNRLTSRATPGETTVSFTYTATGKRASMTDASGTTNYTYDSMDRLISKETPEGTLSYTYDAAGHLASMTSSNANGVSVDYQYDDLNRLSAVIDNRLPSGANTTSYTYDSASNVATVTYPNSVQSQFSYDTLNRVSQLVSSVSGYDYQRDAIGNLKNVVELNGRNVTWTYSTLRFLLFGSEETDSFESRSIAGLAPVSGTFNADDELASETYDANGNVLTTGGKTFAYDSENHLASMNSGAVTIVYDGDGNRVSKTVGGVATTYLVDDLNPTGFPQVVDELTGSAVTRQYTYGLQRISQNQEISSTWTPSFYGYDGGGSVRQLTNASGAVTDSYEYDAYGNLLNSTGTTPNAYMYRGEAYDSDLGLYYLRARWMNPLTGRFLSRDPGKSRTAAPDAARTDQNSDANQEVSFYLFGGPGSTPVSSSTQGCSSLGDDDIRVPQAQHKYNYANGDPINLVDPSGRDAGIEVTLEDSEIEAAEEEGAKAGRCAVVKNLCWSGCFVAVTSAGIHGSDAFADTRACTRRCMAAAGCFNY